MPTLIFISSISVINYNMLKVANDNTPATERPRSLVPIIMPDIPTKYHGYNKVDTATDQYVMFDSSSAYKDVSQTTVPFIDAQPVAPQPASWLGGAGLYHKVREGRRLLELKRNFAKFEVS